MPIQLRHRIAFHQTLVLFVAGLALGTLLSSVQAAWDIANMRKETASMVRELMAAVKVSAVEAAYRLDPDACRDVADGLIAHTYIRKAEIIDDFGSVLTSREMLSEPPRFSVFARFFGVSGAPYDEELVSGTRKVGILRVYPNEQAITERAMARLAIIFATGVVYILLLAGILFFLYYRSTTAPLLKITNHLTGIDVAAPGRAHIPAIWHHEKDELGLLSLTINKMLDRIQSQNEALRKSEEEKRLILDNANEIIAYHDTDHNLLWANKAYLRALGKSLEEVKGKKCYSNWKLDRLCLGCPVTQAIKTGKPQRRELTPETQPHWPSTQGSWTVSAAPVRDASGNIIGAIEIAHDITERKKAEAELSKYQQHLEELVRERTTQLEAAVKELEAFSYSVSHDLRAPLRTIDGFSKALIEDCSGRLPAEGEDYLRRIRSGTQQMGELIESFLKLSRVSRSALTIELVDISAMIQAFFERCRKEEPDRKVSVHVMPDVTVAADRTLIGIAIENLLENAWKFTGKTEKAVIEFARVEKDGRSVYFVRDNGVGFDMAYAGHLFGPFQRLHSMAEFPGNGIGLATVQRVLHRHGGTAWAEGEPGKGATFYFTLPGVSG